MIKVKFIKGKVTAFDDVEYSYEVKNRMHTYIVTITFCGAIEDGEVNLYSSMCADISVQEVKRCKAIIDSNILGLVIDRLDEVCETYEKDDNNMEYFTIKNESDFDSSLYDLRRVIATLAGVLIESQLVIDPTPIIGD